MNPSGLSSCFKVFYRYGMILVLLLGGKYSFTQLGKPLVRWLPPDAMLGDVPSSSPQNWGGCQGRDGLLYFANTTGIIIHDGYRYEKVSGSDSLFARKLATGYDGKVYVAGNNALGVLIPDSIGKPSYQPVLFQREEGGNYPSHAQRVLSNGSSVLFQNSDNLFLISEQDTLIFSGETPFYHPFLVGEEYWVQVENGGISRIAGDKLEFIPGSGAFDDVLIKGIIPRPENKGWWVVTYANGLFQFSGGVASRVNSVLDREKVFAVQKLSETTFCVGTANSGIIFLDDSGEMIVRLDEEDGLGSGTCINIFQDNQQGVWACLGEGMSRINFPFDLTFIGEKEGVSGIALCADQNSFGTWVGTSQGLYRYKEENEKFEPLIEDGIEFNRILEVNGKLYLATGANLYEYDGQRLEVILPNIGLEMIPSKKNPEHFWYGSKGGVIFYSFQNGSIDGQGLPDSSWVRAAKILEVSPSEIWVGGYQDQLGRLEFELENGLPKRVKKITRKFQGLPEEDGLFSIISFEGKVIVGSYEGIWEFQPEDNRFVPAADFQKFKEEDAGFTFYQFENGDIWAFSQFKAGPIIRNDSGELEWNTDPFLQIPRTPVWNIHRSGNGVIFLATTKGVFVYHPDEKRDYRSPFHSTLRKVNLRGDSTIFKGEGKSSVHDLRFEMNDLSFEFASDFYEAPERVKFSFRLLGYSDQWSPWSPEHRTSFTNLSEGKYRFEVKALNPYGVESSIAGFDFSILTPWFRSIWAWIFYGLGFFGLVYAAIQFNSRRLRAQKRKLEKVVAERTVEIREEKKKSDELLLNILPASTAEELKREGKAKTQKYESVSVMFTDFVGFTKVAEKLTPEQLVEEIDKCFREFDEIIGKYGLEKIKTIGDAYMCAAGLPTRREDHAVAIIRAALDIRDYLHRYGQERQQQGKLYFSSRIGIHSGTVIAGVVGKRKYAYDIWGDTVNTASRMESSGVPGNVNISEETLKLVRDEFECVYRGRVYAKNKGLVGMYLVKKPFEVEQDPEGPNYKRLRKAALNLIAEELPDEVLYHGIGHALSVEFYVTEIAMGEGLSAKEIILLRTAGILQDIGYVEDYRLHEEAGIRIAQNLMEENGYSEEEILKICSWIRDTRPEVKPQSRQAAMLRDAARHYLSSGDFEEILNDLQVEFLHYQMVGSEEEFLDHIHDFMHQFDFHTDTARDLFLPILTQNREKTRDLRSGYMPDPAE